MTVYINNINPSNVNEVKQLKVNSKQMHFIETVHECLNEAEKFSQWCPVAIYNDNEIVGFAMYGCFGKKKETWFDRILIDEKYQRQGIGRKAMRLLMFFVLDKYKVNTLYLSIVRENQVARKLYEELGFYYTLVDDLNGELIFKYSKGA